MLIGGVCQSAPANGVYTDNPDMAEWMYNRMYRDSDNPAGGVWGTGSVTARFGRSGDMRRRLSYTMDTAECQIEAAWAGPGASVCSPRHSRALPVVYTYCLFVVANRASLVVDGETVPGTLICPRQDWIPLVGRPLSSCLIGDEFWATQ